MNIGGLLRPDSVVLNLRATDKRRLIDDLAHRIAPRTGLEPSTISEALRAREQLGSTGVGEGIAIPHARLPSLPHAVGLFARLRSALDFESIDGQKVDLVFVLLLPTRAEAEQLDALASVARRLRDNDVRTSVRRFTTSEEVYTTLVGHQY